MFSSTGQHQPDVSAPATFGGGSGDSPAANYSNHHGLPNVAFGSSILNGSPPPRYVHAVAASPTGGAVCRPGAGGLPMSPLNDFPMPSPSSQQGWMSEPTVQCPRTGNLVPHSALSQHDLHEFSLGSSHELAAQQQQQQQQNVSPSPPRMSPASPGTKSSPGSPYNNQVMPVVLASLAFAGQGSIAHGGSGVEGSGAFSIGSPEGLQGQNRDPLPGNAFAYSSTDGNHFMAGSASSQVSGRDELFGSMPSAFAHRLNGDLTLGGTLSMHAAGSQALTQNASTYQTQGSPVHTPHMSPSEVPRHYPSPPPQQQQNQQQQQQHTVAASESYSRRSRSGIGKSPTRKTSGRQSPAPYSPQRRPRTHSESSQAMTEDLSDMTLGTSAPSPIPTSLSPGCESTLSLHSVISGLHDSNSKMAANETHQAFGMSTTATSTTAGNYMLLEQLVNTTNPLSAFAAVDSYREDEAELADLLTVSAAFGGSVASVHAQGLVSDLMSLETVMDSIATPAPGGSGMYEPFTLLTDSAMEPALSEPPVGARGTVEGSNSLPGMESDDTMRMCAGELDASHADMFAGRRSVEGESPGLTSDNLAYGTAESSSLALAGSRRRTPTPSEHMADVWVSDGGGRGGAGILHEQAIVTTSAGPGPHGSDLTGLPFPHGQESVVLHPSLENPYNPKLPTPPIVLTPFTSYETYMRNDDNFDEFIFPDVLNYNPSSDLSQQDDFSVLSSDGSAKATAMPQQDMIARMKAALDSNGGFSDFLPQGGSAGAWGGQYSGSDLAFSSDPQLQQLHDVASGGTVYAPHQGHGLGPQQQQQQQRWLSEGSSSDLGNPPRYHRSHSFQDNSLRPQPPGFVSLHHCHSDSSLVDHGGGGGFDNCHLSMAAGGGAGGGRDGGLVMPPPFDAWATPDAFALERRNRHRSRSASPCANTRAEILFKLRKVVERRLSGADFRITGGTHRK